MRISLYLTTLVGLLILIIGIYHISTASAAPEALPLVHNTFIPATSTVPQETTNAPTAVPTVPTEQNQTQPSDVSVSPADPSPPTYLSIPSINLKAPIIGVGLDAQGNMAVPDGTTSNVGWYAPGTIPGNDGSAVLDAHVFAAFKNLHNVHVGDSIYVTGTTTGVRRFVVTDVETYALADVPAALLFNRTGGKYLNLITCAGTFVPSQNTYDHRLVVFAELAQ